MNVHEILDGNKVESSKLTTIVGATTVKSPVIYKRINEGMYKLLVW
jgi:hypothetical protein